MNTFGPQGGGDQPVLPANDAAEAATVPPQDRPAVATSGNAKDSTPAPGTVADDVNGPDPRATGPYEPAGGPSLPPMSGPVINKPPRTGKQLFTRVKKFLFPLDPHHRKRETQPEFLLKIDLHVMQPELLKLDAAEVMNIRGVALHFL